MTLRAFLSLLVQWPSTLKFKIVAMAAVTGVLAALATAQLALSTTQDAIERLLLEAAGDDRERTAALLASKLELLQGALLAVSRHTAAPLWSDANAMTRFLAEKRGIQAMFDSVFAVNPQGIQLARLTKGTPATLLPPLGDEEYAQRALRSDQPVISKPMRDPVNGAPVLVIAAPAVSADGKVIGMVAGSVPLHSSGMFSNLSGDKFGANIRDLVMDRSGVLLAHTNVARVLGKALDEPGLGSMFAQWHGSGSPIDTVGTASMSDGYLLSQAGIPGSDWVLVRLTPQAVALAPVASARHTAWKAAAGVGLVSAVLAGLLAWLMTRPISALRSRAEMLLSSTASARAPWPQGQGEVGDLSRAFQHVVELNQQRQAEVQALVLRLEAVLDHAEVGIALSRNHRFELVSQHFCDMFHCSREEALGQSTRSIYPSDAACQALYDKAQPAFTQFGAYAGEMELVRRTGQTFWAHMRGRAVLQGDPSKGTIWTIEDVTAAREHREQLAWSASHDGLTGLANRAAFEALLVRETALSAVSPFCALFVDLDRFKQVNDTGGHAAGDALLRDVAQQLVAQVRRSDTVARLGGDEFAILLSNCPLPRAQSIAEQLRAAVSNYRLEWEGKTYSVGASLGLVAVSGNYASAAEVLKDADEACYVAKRHGRDRVEVIHRAAQAEPLAA